MQFLPSLVDSLSKISITVSLKHERKCCNSVIIELFSISYLYFRLLRAVCLLLKAWCLTFTSNISIWHEFVLTWNLRESTCTGFISCKFFFVFFWDNSCFVKVVNCGFTCCFQNNIWTLRTFIKLFYKDVRRLLLGTSAFGGRQLA